MKTLEDCKRHVAYSVGHPGWNELLVSLAYGKSTKALDHVVNLVLEMYTKEAEEQAIAKALGETPTQTP